MASAAESERVHALEQQIKAKDEDLSQIQSDLRVANYTIQQLEAEIATLSKAGLGAAGAGAHATPHKKKKKAGKRKKRSEGKATGSATDRSEPATAETDEVARPLLVTCPRPGYRFPLVDSGR